MTITLTREEAQQMLDVIERNIVGVPRREASDMLRAKLAKKEFVVPPIDGDTTPWARSDEGW